MATTYIKCRHCGHKEKLNARFVLKVIGASATGLGAGGWVTYLFAGTGLALEICAALVIGGAAILAFSEQIGEWFSKKYDCPGCQKRDWVVTDE